MKKDLKTELFSIHRYFKFFDNKYSIIIQKDSHQVEIPHQSLSFLLAKLNGFLEKTRTINADEENYTLAVDQSIKIEESREGSFILYSVYGRESLSNSYVNFITITRDYREDFLKGLLYCYNHIK